MTRPQFIYEVKELMKEHKLTEKQVVQVLALLHGISCELSAEDNLVLIHKRLLKPDNTVNVKVLFKRDSDRQQTIKFNFNSKANVSEETVAIAENLEKAFVPKELLTEVHVKNIADEFFSISDLAADLALRLPARSDLLPGVSQSGTASCRASRRIQTARPRHRLR